MLGNNLDNSGLVAELTDSANTKYIIKAFDGQTSSSALIDVTQYAQDLANKATRDLDNLTAAGLQVITDLIPEGTGIVAQNLATNGYIKFANGFILQWGTVNSPGNSGASVTLPIAFSNAFLAGQATSINNVIANISSANKTSIKVAAYSGDVYWAAIGY